MGIATVAVYSDPDRSLPFVGEADEGIALGGESAAESYLRIDALIDAARRTAAEAIHPGYGFLAESPAFARAVLEAGLIWVGPPPDAIASMGDKLEAKRRAVTAGLLSLPTAELTEGAEPQTAAAEIGYPLLVKAAAGGGGKGMRIVRSHHTLSDAVASSRREAAAAFGDDRLFLERYLEAPRHIEIQVMADQHGNLVSLFERECSIQRRHQKIIEETPSTIIDDALRKRMGEAAVALAREVGYLGAGTVEFLYQEGEFYFLEMNTRLQVEHPITEAVTGLDLVRLQLLVAAGEPLPEEALAPVMMGHAIEARLYAEDPLHDFLPTGGRVDRFRFPEGVRVETGVEDGSEVSVFYDPMLAKIIAWAETRAEAGTLLASSLQRAVIHGTITNRDLLVRILRHPEFLAGRTDTHFLDRHPATELGKPLPSREEELLAAVAAALCDQEARRRRTTLLPTIPSGWRNNPSQLQTVFYHGSHGEIEVGYRFERSRGITVYVGGDLLYGVRLHRPSPDRIGLEVEGHLRWFDVNRVGPVLHVDGPAGYSRLLERPRFPAPSLEEEAGSLHAPMPGKVIRVEVSEGDTVEEGQVLIVMEAMKMEHTLRAPQKGVVKAVRTQAGDQVDAEQVLVLVEEG
jgi:acetyl/propionyl-CoA carboxylase alpha subunit